jgi:hypothetical protein
MNLTQEEKDLVTDAIAELKNAVEKLETMAAHDDFEGIVNALNEIDNALANDEQPHAIGKIIKALDMLEEASNE